jgi:hypothetical protein
MKGKRSTSPIFLLALAMLSSPVGNASDPPHIAVFTEEHQILLTVKALNEATEDPSPLNLDMLGPALPDDRREHLFDMIRQVMAPYREDSVTRMTFEPEVTVKTRDGHRLTMTVLVEVGRMSKDTSLELNFESSYPCPVITNLDDVFKSLGPFLGTSFEQMQPHIGTIEPTVVHKASRSTLSNGMFLPRNLYQSNTRFNSSVSHNLFDLDISSGPSAPYGYVYDDETVNELDIYFLVQADQNNYRITVSANRPYNDDWFAQFGGFYKVNSIAHMGMQWYASCDTVVEVFEIEWNGDYDHQATIQGFNRIVDIDAAAIPNGTWPEYELAVLDSVSKNIYIYDYSEVLQRTLYSHCTRPSSITYVYNYITGDPMHYLYVADNASDRIVLIDTWGIAQPTVSESGLFGSNANLVAMTFDGYGGLYVVDRENAEINLLCASDVVPKFGNGPGAADDQLFYPRDIHSAKGVFFDDGPDTTINLKLGDFMATEIYGGSTGVRRFVNGSDILDDYTMTYTPQPPNDTGWNDRVRIDWTHTGPSETWREIWANGVLLDSQHDLINTAGDHYHYMRLTPAEPDHCYYKFIIRVRSVFQSTDVTLVDSFYVDRYVNPGPRWVVDSTVITDPEGILYPWCLYVDQDKWWRLDEFVRDAWHDSDLTLYTYPRYSGIHIYPDTMGSSPVPYLVHPQDESVWFKVSYFPTGLYSGQWANLFRGYHTTDEYDPELDYWEYNWDFDDTIYTWQNIWKRFCETSCSEEDCPEPDFSCPTVSILNGPGYDFVNNILSESEYTSGEVTDVIPIYGAQITDDQYHIRVSEDENEVSHFREFTLYTVDFPSDFAEFIVSDDQGICAVKGYATPVGAVTDRGEDVLDVLLDEDRMFTTSSPGHLDLEVVCPERPMGLGPKPPPKNHKKIAAGELVPNIVTVSAWDGTGYAVVSTFYPKMEQEITLAAGLEQYAIKDTLRVRLEWTTGISLNTLPCVMYEDVEVIRQTAETVTAVHSNLGSIAGKLGVDDVVLKPGQNIDLVFKAQPPAEGTTRVLFFSATGSYTSKSVGSALPTGFALHQNYPNPFNPTTTLSFSLPEAGAVKLEIFNVIGQKVATVVDGQCAAGEHRVEWSGIADNGENVSSGVYLYRLTTAEHQATRKMVMLK